MRPRAYAYPIFLPIEAGPTRAEAKLSPPGFDGVIDVVNQKAIRLGSGRCGGQRRRLNYEVKDIPAEHKERAKAALAELIDAVSNKDDEIAGLVIEEKPITPQVLKGGDPPADLQD